MPSLRLREKELSNTPGGQQVAAEVTEEGSWRLGSEAVVPNLRFTSCVGQEKGKPNQKEVVLLVLFN